MRWDFIEVFGKGIKCSVCQREIQEQEFCNWYYVPNFDDSEEDDERAKQIEMLFGVDPFTDFLICENCMESHCGAVPGLDANNWLEEKLVEHGKKDPAEIDKKVLPPILGETLISETLNELKQLMQKDYIKNGPISNSLENHISEMENFLKQHRQEEPINIEHFPPPAWEEKK